VIKANRFDEAENMSKTQRIVNKVQQAKDVKNAVKRLVK